MILVWRDAMRNEANPCIHHARFDPPWDLSPVNYISDIIQQRVYQTKVQDVNDLRQRLIDVGYSETERNFVDAIAWPDLSMPNSSQKMTFWKFTVTQISQNVVSGNKYTAWTI